MPTIAYLGPEHTNTHLAALKKFGRLAEYVHAPTVEDVFRLVEQGKTRFGVVPIENSLEGAVTHTLDWFIDSRKNSSVRIHGELEQPIQHWLIVRPRTVLSQVEAVFSHPQALAQCRRWLDEHLPKAERRETNSTAEAVRSLLDKYVLSGVRINKSGKTLVVRSIKAAIARKELVEGYKLRAITIPIRGENKTRFLVLGIGNSLRGRHNKTSVLFALKDQPGALYDALMPFKKERINLTKIESRPSKRKAWEYYFFIDLEGHTSEPKVKKALEALKTSTSFFKVLGSYPVKS